MFNTQQPLPSILTNQPSEIVEAMRRCRKVEAAITRDLEKATARREVATLKQNLVDVRILGHLLSVGPSEVAKLHVAQTITSCEDDGLLIKQGCFYNQHFVRTLNKSSVLKAKGPTPEPSRHLSISIFNETQALVVQDLKPSPRDHRHAKSSDLRRDNQRCVISGHVETKYLERQVAQGFTLNINWKHVAQTECSHVFSESTNWDLRNYAK
ncbi:uncharacterized protein PHACADRAFT_33849, partial [Phanerochaete carnosa HHB-10118-sp]